MELTISLTSKIYNKNKKPCLFNDSLNVIVSMMPLKVLRNKVHLTSVYVQTYIPHMVMVIKVFSRFIDRFECFHRLTFDILL